MTEQELKKLGIEAYPVGINTTNLTEKLSELAVMKSEINHIESILNQKKKDFEKFNAHITNIFKQEGHETIKNNGKVFSLYENKRFYNKAGRMNQTAEWLRSLGEEKALTSSIHWKTLDRICREQEEKGDLPDSIDFYEVREIRIKK